MIKTYERGNAMVYILIAVALFGALSVTLSRQNDNADEQGIDDERVALYANEIIEYVSSMQNTVDQMIFTGSEINDLDFVTPSEAAFNTGSNVHKVFHPQGGGLNYRASMKSNIANDATSQWSVNNGINVEWTDSAADDVIFTAYFIREDVCAYLNQQITGSNTIPATANPHDEYFLSTGTTDLDTTECAGCDGYSSLCIENDTGDNYSFYSIIAAQ